MSPLEKWRKMYQVYLLALPCEKIQQGRETCIADVYGRLNPSTSTRLPLVTLANTLNVDQKTVSKLGPVQFESNTSLSENKMKPDLLEIPNEHARHVTLRGNLRAKGTPLVLYREKIGNSGYLLVGYKIIFNRPPWDLLDVNP